MGTQQYHHHHIFCVHSQGFGGPFSYFLPILGTNGPFLVVTDNFCENKPWFSRYLLNQLSFESDVYFIKDVMVHFHTIANLMNQWTILK